MELTQQNFNSYGFFLDETVRKNVLLDGVERLKNAPEALAEVLRTFKDALKVIDADGRYNHEFKQELRADARDKARVAIDRLNTQFDAEAQRFLASVPPIAEPRTTEEAMLFEQRAPRLWERAKSQLDGGIELQQVLESSDRDMLDVIDQEISAYYAIRFKSNTTVIKSFAEAARDLINHYRPSVSSLAAAVRFNQRAEIESGIQNVKTAFVWARFALDERETMPHLPAWERGQSVQVYI